MSGLAPTRDLDLPDPLHRLLGFLWCRTCEHTHIPDIPATTFLCASECGFGAWSLDVASDHVDRTGGHNVYPIVHTLVPLADREAHECTRRWVEAEVSDWYDPVMDPDTIDNLRAALGMAPYDRED